MAKCPTLESISISQSEDAILISENCGGCIRPSLLSRQFIRILFPGLLVSAASLACRQKSMGDKLVLHFQGVLRCKNLLAAVGLGVALALTGCVSSSDRILDERDALADSYFTGRFAYRFVDKVREMQIFQNGKKYLIEENGKLVSLATLHPLRDDFLIVQTWNTKRGGADPPYVYYLLRKTADGFEVGKELCSEADRLCTADTRTELLRKLELQTRLFLSEQEKRLSVRRL